MNLKEVIRKIEELEKQLQKEIESSLSDVEEVDSVKRLNSNCFTISFKSLNNMNLSPEHYDTKKQVSLLIEKLKRCKNVESIKERIQECIITKNLEVSKGYRIELHPIVLKRMEEVFAEI